MANIGSRAHAAEILNVRNVGWTDQTSPNWELVGSGYSRDAYLHTPSDVVYKVPSSTWLDYIQHREARNARSFRKRLIDAGVTSVRVPKVSLYTVDNVPILAMEYVRGTMIPWISPTDIAAAGRVALFHYGRFGDMHNENFIVDEDGKVVPIDMGSYRGWDSDGEYCGPDDRVLSGIPSNTVNNILRRMQ